MDSSSTVLLGLLRTGAKLQRKKQGTSSTATDNDVELEPAVRAVLGAAKCAEEILKRVPVDAAAALEQLEH
jgi:hypothetical protein